MLSKVVRSESAADIPPLSWLNLLEPEEPEPEAEAAVAAEGEEIPADAPPAPPPNPLAEEVQRLRGRLAEMESLLERRMQEAHQKGFREGEAAGKKQGAAEVQPVIDKLAHSIRELAGFRDVFRRKAEPDLIKLAIAIAGRILRRELSVDPEAVGGLLKAGFEKLRRQEACRVRLHPSHKPAVQRWLEQRPSDCPIEVVADPSLQVGAVIFETAGGDLDASASTQLAEIEAGLVDVLRRRS